MLPKDHQEEPNFRLQLGEGFIFGVRRVLCEQLIYALHRLKEDGDAADQSLYEARKAIKRVRSTLRLLRPALSPRTFQTHNGALAKISRRLGVYRDRDALLATFDGLLVADKPLAAELGWVRESLVVLAEQSKATGQKEAMAQAAAMIQKQLRQQSRLSFVDTRPQSLARGFKAVRQDVAKCWGAAKKDLDTDAIHELRKRLKNLRDALMLLSLLWDQESQLWRRHVGKLAKMLGQEHDLALLSTYVQKLERPVGGGDPLAAANFLAMIASRRREIQKRSLKKTRKILQERPRGLSKAAFALNEASSSISTSGHD